MDAAEASTSKRVDKLTTDIVCNKCDISFSAKKNLYRHQRNFHSQNEINVPSNRICPVCDSKLRTIAELHSHIEEAHEGIHLNHEKKVFYSDSDFKEWKDTVEKDTISYFTRKGSFERDESVVTYYECHKSGVPICKKPSERIRHSKSSVSIKTGKTCPAFMKVVKKTIHEATEITVEFQNTHVGHEHKAGDLRLTRQERSELAGMLDAGIPTSVVLDKIVEQYSPTKRFRITDRQDITNIKRDFRLEKAAHKDDAMSVDIMVQKMMADNSILVYKPVSEDLAGYPNIGSEEFLLGFATEAQIQLLQLYGESVIMIDSTHGTNYYKYQLTTIVVNDENHQGIPVACLFSTRVACETFEPFFQAIKEKFPNFKTKLFLSDDTNSFYNAWQNVFQDNAKHILCAWHVLRNWNLNLRSKVKDESLRMEMKKDMEVFLHEFDVGTFQKYVRDFLVKYEKETSFMRYFKDYYSERTEKWAYCYRLGLGANVNMKLERWHRQIKYEEAGGKVMKRLDKSLSIVLKAITKKLLGRIIAMERGKVTHRVSLIRKRHATGVALDENVYSLYDISNEKWTIAKADNGSIFTYEIEIGNRDCECPIKCADCGICIHTLTCTCIDYNIRYVICKHIHFFCQKFNFSIKLSRNSITNDDGDDELVIHLNENKEKQLLEKSVINNQLRKKPRTDISVQKSNLSMRLALINSQIQTLETSEDLDGAAEYVKNFELYLQRISSRPCLPVVPENVRNEPENKLIEKQRKKNNKKK